MKTVRSLVLATSVIALMLLGLRLAFAQQPQQYYGAGGGMITGTVLGFDMWDQLQPIDWAAIYANNGQRTFLAYSGASGFYEMFVPVGTYNVTIVEPGYKQYSNTVAVSDGSTSTINFYLEQSHVPVPEFQPNWALLVMVLTLGATMVIRRHKYRSKH